MNIAMILTNGFDPDPRVYKEAKTLTKLGHSVEILCWDRSGKYIDKPEENLEGFKVKRFFGNAVYGTGYKQISKFLDFKNDILNYIKGNKFDAIHCHDFDGLFIGDIINNKLKLKLVYDEHDLFYTYFSGRKGIINNFISKFIVLKEKMILKKVDAHIVVTPKMYELYKKANSNTYVVNNAPYKGLFTDIEKTPYEKLRIGFIGSVRYYKELKTLIEVSQKFKSDIEIIINGNGICIDELRSFAKDFDNVKITGGYSIKELENLYKNIDITYAFYPSFEGAISMPNKFFESIITETPIIANSNTEFGYEVNKLGIGYSVSEENLAEDLENVLSKLTSDKRSLELMIENMKNNKEDFYWEANEKTLDSLYKSI